MKRLIVYREKSTVRESSAACDLSIGTIDSTLHKDLHMRNLTARLVPYYLSEDQKKQWVECSRKLLDEFDPSEPK